jgi:6-phosphogluconolactonase
MATLIIGSYTHSLPHVVAKGNGISILKIDDATGVIELLETVSDLRNPTYLAISSDGRTVYGVEEFSEEDGAGVAIMRRDEQGNGLSLVARLPVFGDAPCHVSLDEKGRWLFVCNYQSGNVIAYALGVDGRPVGEGIDIRRSGSGPNPLRQEGPHAHQATISPDNRHVLICDAGADEIARYAISETYVEKAPDLVVKARPGSLPRHLTFSKNGQHVFVLHELSCTIASYAYENDGMRLVDEVSTLPTDFSGVSAGAAIRLHPQGRFVYASNRGHDSIVAFEVNEDDGTLKPIGWYETRGKTPRDFAIDPEGMFLVAANQDSDTLAVFAIDQTTGALQQLGDTFEIGTPVSVLFA